jgi:hypothetical protein
MSEYRPCRACGCPLRFVPGPNGKPIPLDLRSPVYRVTADLVGAPLAERDTAAYVSHFCSCAKASEFSGAKRGAR